MCTFLRISLHYICGAQKIRPIFRSEQVLCTYFAYLRYCTVPDCHSPGDRFSSVQIDDIFTSPARHTLLSHVASGENVGRKPLPPAIQRDVTPVLSDDAALFLFEKLSIFLFPHKKQKHLDDAFVFNMPPILNGTRR